MLTAYIALLFYPRDVPWMFRPRLDVYGLELSTYDAIMKATKPVIEVDPRLRIVGIDTVSMHDDVLGPMPWPRAVHGKLIEKISQDKGAGVAFDVEFLTPSSQPESKANDGAFAAAIMEAKAANGNHPFVVIANHLGALVESDDTATQDVASDRVDSLEILREAGAVQGFIDSDSSGSNGAHPIMRRARLARLDGGQLRMVDGQLRRGQRHLVPSLDLAAIAVLKKVPLEKIVYGASYIEVGDLVIPTSQNYEINIAYYIPEGEGIDELSPIPYARMVGAKLPEAYVGSRLTPGRAEIEGALFLVGGTAPDLGDNATSPFGAVPGVFIHAQILNTILSQKWIRDTSSSLYLATMLLLPLVVLLLMLRTSGFGGLLIAIIAIIVLWSLSAWLMTHGWWLRPLGPTVTTAFATGAFAVYQFLRGHMLLRQFITPELAHDLMNAGGEAAHTSEQDCTVIFSDIRGFTTLNESMGPSKMVELLKEYHSLTVPIYEKHGGRCLDYLGDAQMVVYGDPMTLKRAKEKNHAVAALQAGVEVHEVILQMNWRWKARNDPPFEVGIGACSGIVAIGVLGADTAHLQYTVIGDVTNTAARVQGLSRDLRAPVICTESTIERAGDRVVSDRLQSVALKGKAKEVTVYRVLGLKDDPTTVERMRAHTETVVKSLAIVALAAASLFGAGCSSAPPPSPPSTPSQQSAAESPSVGVMPVGTPIVVATVKPASTPAAPTAKMTGGRVTYATPPAPAQPQSELPAPTPKQSLPVGTSEMDGMTLPIYPNSVKQTQSVLPVPPNTEQLVMVLITSDSPSVVKQWYKERMNTSAIFDSGSDKSNDRKINMKRHGGKVSDADRLDKVTITSGGRGTTQILLMMWRNKP